LRASCTDDSHISVPEIKKRPVKQQNNTIADLQCTLSRASPPRPRTAVQIILGNRLSLRHLLLACNSAEGAVGDTVRADRRLDAVAILQRNHVIIWIGISILRMSHMIWIYFFPI